MKYLSFIAAVLVASAVLFSGVAQAAAPFINLEGVGGVAFNPLAYPAATPGEGGKVGGIDVAKPRIGAFYTNLDDTDIDWTTLGIATTFAKRLEVSYGFETIAIAATTKNTHKNNIGLKLLLLEENAFGSNFIPAISAGGLWKRTNFQRIDGMDNNGFDAYLVATKLVTQLPVPFLVSAGVLTTQGHVNGVLGFDSKRREIFFGNLDVFPLSWLAAGFEYKQGPDYGAYKDADYYDLHACWFVDKSLTLVAAFVNGGNRHAHNTNGLGGGPVLSAQYAF